MSDSDAKEIATIVLVEDHAATRALLIDLIEATLADVRVIATGTASGALDLCRRRTPHLIVMDIQLPDASGIETARTLKARLPEVAIVMHSNHDADVFREESLEAGASAFLSKLDGPTELVAAIRRLLERSGGRRLDGG